MAKLRLALERPTYVERFHISTLKPERATGFSKEPCSKALLLVNGETKELEKPKEFRH
jgi:hypothetical protein